MTSPALRIALDAIYNDANVATTARYVPQSGGAPAHFVRILWKHPDAAFKPFAAGGQAPQRVAELRVTRGTQGLAEGDLLIVGQESFTVANARRDRGGLYWTVEVA